MAIDPKIWLVATVIMITAVVIAEETAASMNAVNERFRYATTPRGERIKHDDCSRLRRRRNPKNLKAMIKKARQEGKAPSRRAFFFSRG